MTVILSIFLNFVAMAFCVLMYLSPDNFVVERGALLFGWIAAMNVVALFRSAA